MIIFIKAIRNCFHCSMWSAVKYYLYLGDGERKALVDMFT